MKIRNAREKKKKSDRNRGVWESWCFWNVKHSAGANNPTMKENKARDPRVVLHKNIPLWKKYILLYIHGFGPELCSIEYLSAQVYIRLDGCREEFREMS